MSNIPVHHQILVIRAKVIRWTKKKSSRKIHLPVVLLLLTYRKSSREKEMEKQSNRNVIQWSLLESTGDGLSIIILYDLKAQKSVI